MLIAQNPYIAGNPVGGSTGFIGRIDILREVTRVLENPNENSIVLFGQRRIGKTSILQQLAHQLPSKGNYIPVYFDLQDKATWRLEQVLLDLARVIAHSLNIADPETGNFNQADFFQSKFIPQTLNNLPDTSALVLLFDEFDVLDAPTHKQAIKTFFPYLRQLMTISNHRLQFVFVIGRKPEDLDVLTLSVFKGVKSKRVSLLKHEDAVALILKSHDNETLSWSHEAIDEVWQLTNGHPYLTQLLCQIIWNRAYDVDPDDIPIITLADVQSAIPETIETSVNALEWLWNGLAPAEKIVASVLAEKGLTPINQSELEQILMEGGAKIVIRQLQNAPKILQDWDLIEPVSKGYKFRVELLRRWIAEKKPVKQIQQELDFVVPLAENLYQAGQSFYQRGQLEDAINDLQRSLDINPNHLRSGLLLAQVHLEQHNIAEAISLLETIYARNPGEARPRLVQALLEQADNIQDENEKLNVFNRVLSITPHQPQALKKHRAIWEQRGDNAHKEQNFSEALIAYEKAGVAEKIEIIKNEIRDREFTTLKTKFEELEDEKMYQLALETLVELETNFPEHGVWTEDKERLEQKLNLSETYTAALKAFRKNNTAKAQKLLAQVVYLEPEHSEALRFLLKLTQEVDIAVLQKETAASQETIAELRNEIVQLDINSQEEITELRAKIADIESASKTRELKLEKKIRGLQRVRYIWMTMAISMILICGTFSFAIYSYEPGWPQTSLSFASGACVILLIVVTLLTIWIIKI